MKSKITSWHSLTRIRRQAGQPYTLQLQSVPPVFTLHPVCACVVLPQPVQVIHVWCWIEFVLFATVLPVLA
jgi:hypothetical protein